MPASSSTASAAVAIIRCPDPDESYLILRRAARPQDPWSGHYSFPGGRKEPGDPDLLATCIRETEEETGIILTPDLLLRRLGRETAGHYSRQPVVVQPFLFSLPSRQPLRLAPDEIQGAVWLDAARFRDPGSHLDVEMLPGRLFPAYPVLDYYLWGFTYRLLRTILNMDDESVATAN
jgi:8-oxo-dGTP pyrophosphatase MutT (NUDIX family)